MPVASLLELTVNDISDQQDLASSQEIRDDESCQSRDKDHSNTADHSRKASWEDDLPESIDGSGSKIPGCQDNIPVKF